MKLPLLLLLHAAATLFMTGLIWFVQIVHYPLFASVGRADFAAYEREHTRRTTLVVGPVMLVEALAAIALLAARPSPAAWSGLGLLAVIWISTAFLQVPQHNILGFGFDPAAHARLVQTNWLRTAAWTARALLALGLLRRYLPA
jgi:hypothetical protein